MPVIKGFIFDLDGVLVDTARFHFKAWHRLAETIGIEFSEKQNEQLKGVGRTESLKKILEWGERQVGEEEFERLMRQKNEWYLAMVEEIQEGDTLPGVKELLKDTRNLKLRIALGSASKNARMILDKVNIAEYFDAIVDGKQTSRSKPDPQVFNLCAEALGLKPESLVVFEDSQAGVEAANNGGFYSVGIGNKKTLSAARLVYQDLRDVRPAEIINRINFEK